MLVRIHYCLAFSCLLLFNMTKGNQNAPKFVNIGGMFQSFNHDGAQEMAAFLMAIREINDKYDGIADHLLPNTRLNFEVKSSDGSYLGAVLGALAMSMTDFNKTGILGCIGAHADIESEAIAQVFNAFDTNQISYASTASALSYSGPYPRFYRTCTSEAAQSVALADMIYNYFGWRKVTLFYTSDSYGSDGGYEFKQEAQILGIDILSSHLFEPGQKDLSDVIDAAKAVGTRIFVLFMTSNDAVNLLQHGYQAGLFHDGTQVLGSGFMTVQQTIDNMTNAADVPSIMGGYIGLLPAFGLGLTFNTNFINRWRSQRDTVHYFSNGTMTCDNSKDDNGQYIYKNSNGVCNGLQFSKFAVDGSDLANYVPFSYDATYALARAIHIIVEDMKQPTVDRNVLTAVLAVNVSFIGVTGNVSFRQGDVNTGYGYGDRLHDFKFNVLNYRPGVKPSRGSFVSVGTWFEGKGFVPCQSTSCAIRYSTADNSQPTDTPSPIYITMDVGLRVYLGVLSFVCFVVVLGLTIAVIKYSKKKLIKAAQPKMLLMVLLGGLIGCFRVANAAFDVTDATCISGTWLAHLCFGIVMISLLAKTWRVCKVVTSGFKKVVVMESLIIQVSFLGILLVCVYLMVISVVGKPRLAYRSNDLGKLQVENYSTCTSSMPNLAIGLYVVEGASLLYGWYLCWATKNVPDAINEAKHIALGMCVMYVVRT